MKIGFFDSGVGGFTILNAVRNRLPEYDYVFYGDTANVPYGNKSEEDVFALTLQGVQALFERGTALVIIACNTASAETLRKMQDLLIPHVYKDRRILGVIIPTVETIIDQGPSKVLLIGTQRTVSSKKYDMELTNREVHAIELESIATPGLVPLLEQGRFADALEHLDSLIGDRIGEKDTLILGCTHYVLLKHLVRSRYPHLRVISQDEIIPEKLSMYLERHADIRNELDMHGTLEVILTKDEIEYRNRMLNLFSV